MHASGGQSGCVFACWSRLLARRHGYSPAAGAAAAVVYAVANLTWAIAGESLAAPPKFDTAAQKSLLVSTGLLALAGASAVRLIVHGRSTGRHSESARWWVPLTLGWVGSASTFASGLSQYALAAAASPNSPTSLLLALGTISGVMMGVAALLAIAGPSGRWRWSGGYSKHRPDGDLGARHPC
jgi:hypothetical protein